MAANIEYPETEDLQPDEWKLLFMVLVENRANVDLTSALTPYGRYLFSAACRKIAINTVGVDSETDQAAPFEACPECGQPLTQTFSK